MGPVVDDQEHEGWVLPLFADGAQGAGINHRAATTLHGTASPSLCSHEPPGRRLQGHGV